MPQEATRLTNDRFHLSLRAVRLQCLDENRQALFPDAVASGFLMTDRTGATHLYTSWHVVTGFDMRDPQWVPLPPPPRRCFLRIDMQDAQQRNPNVIAIGGRQTLELPLYDPAGRPMWQQDQQHRPHADLNPIGFKVPFWMDAARLRLPADVRTTDLQVIQDPSEVARGTMLLLGEPVHIVGYPYGYSAAGLRKPTAVVLTRNVAATLLPDHASDFLLDGAGAEGMSGGPVFVEREERLRLVGIYSGAIFPKRANERVRDRDLSTSLGVCSDFVWGLHDRFVSPDDSIPVDPPSP